VILHPTIPIGSHFFAKKSAVDSGESGGDELKATGSSSVNRNLSAPVSGLLRSLREHPPQTALATWPAADRNHGHGCRHEALVDSSADEFVAATVPFVRQGLARSEDVLVVLRTAGRTVLREALDRDAARVEFADAVDWYRSPEHAFQGYSRYLDDRLERGARRVRVVAEVVWPESSARAAVAKWKRYEAGISAAMASVPVSFICAYDIRELPADMSAMPGRRIPSCEPQQARGQAPAFRSRPRSSAILSTTCPSWRSAPRVAFASAL
jgi:MEDS: MEthanogen/methylotroph, DcmR Sensory domain